VEENVRGQDMAEMHVMTGSMPFIEVMNKCAQKLGTNSFLFHNKKKRRK